MLLVLLIILMVLAVGGGAWAHPRYGYYGWSPAGLIVLIVILLWLAGYLRF